MQASGVQRSAEDGACGVEVLTTSSGGKLIFHIFAALAEFGGFCRTPRKSKLNGIGWG